MELVGHATTTEHGATADSPGGVQSRHGRKKAMTGRSQPSMREKGKEGRGVACAGLASEVGYSVITRGAGRPKSRRGGGWACGDGEQSDD